MSTRTTTSSAIEDVGSKLCNQYNTDNPLVLVKEVATSVDATLFGSQDSIAAGKEQFMVGSTTNGIRRSLLQFPISSFPSDARVECVEVRLSVVDKDTHDGVGFHQHSLQMYRLTSDWTTAATASNILNGINGGTAKKGDATWRYSSYPTQEWRTPGGDYDTSIKLVTSSASEGMLDHQQGFEWFGKSAEMASLVEEWIQGSRQNFGFMLIGPEKQPGSTSYIRYNGMESTPDLIPRLIVSYTSPLEGTPHLPLSERHYYNSGGSKGGRIVTTWAILLSVLLAMMMIGAVVTLHRRRQKQSTKKTDSSLHAPHAAALQGMSAADDDDDEDAVVFDDVKDLPVMAHEKEII